ncbi:HNH endonuclease [Aeromonas veronii]
MADRISIPYSPTSDEKKIIKKYFKTDKDWDNVNFEPFKANLIAHLRHEQNNKCCYCKWELGYDIKNVDIEHIIPKSTYNKFTFTTKNLALSCPGCNTSKGSKNVLHKQIKNYPQTGKNILIIHPHFDDYNSCIDIHEGAIYEAIDDAGKGCDTIKICKLHRMKTVLKKMRETKTQKSLVSELVEALMNASPEEQEAISNALRTLTNNFQGR